MQNTRHKTEVDLINGPIDSTLRRFSAPLILSFIITMLYAWIDMYFISRLGTNEIAALGVSEQLLFLIFGLAGGFAIGSGIIIARRVGEGNVKQANYIATQGFVFMLALSTAIALVLYFNLNSIFFMMGIKGKVAFLAKTYMTSILLGVPFNFAIFQVNSMLRSSGDSFVPMIILIATIVMNAIFAPFFIFGLGPFPMMGVYGAGLATALSECLGAILSLIAIMRKSSKVHLSFTNFKIDTSIIWNIIKLGFPASLQMISISLSRLVISAIAVSFGTNVLTTYTIGLRLDLFIIMIVLAVGAAIEIITSQNIGAGKPERVFKFHKSAVIQLSVLMIAVGVLVFLFGENVARIFTKSTTIIQEAGNYMRIMSMSYLFFAIGLISVRVISGSGDYMRSFRIFAIMLFAIQVPLAYLLSNYKPLSENGIWIGMLLGQIAFSIISLMSLWKKKWMRISV